MRIKIYDKTFKKSSRRKCSTVISMTIKFAVPVIYFVVVELLPLRGGGTRT